MRLTLFAIILGGPVLADERAAQCDELWFSRNAMMDQAGYCFESPLGRAIFDNADCTAGDPVLSDAARTAIGTIRAVEAEMGCHVDTGRTSLDVADLQARRQLDIQPEYPASSMAEVTCGGYTGAARSVHAAPDASARLIGSFGPGSDLDFDHGAAQGWNFARVRTAPTEPWMVGWIYLPEDMLLPSSMDGVCNEVAG